MRWIGNSCDEAMNRRYERPLICGSEALNKKVKVKCYLLYTRFQKHSFLLNNLDICSQGVNQVVNKERNTW